MIRQVIVTAFILGVLVCDGLSRAAAITYTLSGPWGQFMGGANEKSLATVTKFTVDSATVPSSTTGTSQNGTAAYSLTSAPTMTIGGDPISNFTNGRPNLNGGLSTYSGFPSNPTLTVSAGSSGNKAVLKFSILIQPATFTVYGDLSTVMQYTETFNATSSLPSNDLATLPLLSSSAFTLQYSAGLAQPTIAVPEPTCLAAAAFAAIAFIRRPSQKSRYLRG